MQGYDLPVYRYRASPEQRTGARIRHPVVIVGAGLAGLTAACDLAARGVPAVVLDEDDTVGVRGLSSRGICYARRSLDIFDRLGIAERIRAKGETWSVGRVLDAAGEVFRFDLATDAANRHPPFINLQQFYVEWFLVDRIEALSVAEIRWKNRVVGVDQRADHVLVEVDTPDGPYRVEASWLLACDGVHSIVRQCLGVPVTREQGHDRWCISDVRLGGDRPVERWTWIEASFNDNRGVWQHLMGDSVWRLDFQMPPDADPEAVSRPEVVAARLRQMLGPEAEFELVWAGPYSYRLQVLDRFRDGRVFFLGDAAHLMSPFGARGGNSGIQDADNIAWKLALVLAGRAPEGLLDSYDEERRPAARHNVRLTARAARFMAPRSPAEQRLRKAVLGLARRQPFARALLNAGRLSDPFVYDASSLTTSGGEAAPNLAVRLPDGRPGFLHDRLGRALAFEGLWFADAPPSAARIEALEALARASVPLRTHLVGAVAASRMPSLGDPEGTLARCFGAAPGSFILLRPDLHVAARWPRLDLDALRTALARACGGPR